MNLRRRLLPVHRWAGLTLGLLVLVSAATGAGMAFRAQLEPVFYPRLARQNPCANLQPLDAYVAAARAARPHGKVDYLRVRAGADLPVIVRFLDKDTIYLDRCTAAVRAQQNRYEGFFGTLEWLHRGQWWSGGGRVMGVGALALLAVLVPLGTYLWWPRDLRRLGKGFMFNLRLKGTAFHLALHRSLGAWGALALTVSATTALPNAFDAVRAYLVSSDAPPARVLAPGLVAEHPAVHPLSMQAAWSTIQRLTPAPREVLLHRPRSAREPMEIFIIERQAPHPNARTYLYLDGGTGEVLRILPYRQSSPGSRLYYWMLSIHTAQIGGVAGAAFLFLGATCAVGLGCTGVTSYFRRRLRS